MTVRLDVAHDVVVVALGSLAVPLAVLQASVEGDQPALGQVLGGGLAGLAERRSR